MYKIAVIIPTLNEEKFIAKCLDSIIAQTFAFADMDVIVVDGGSHDRTQDIVEDYCRRWHNIRFIHNPGKIQSIAFNIGMKCSDAPYIARMDAHTTYDRDYIRHCMDIYAGRKDLNGCTPEEVGNVGGVCRILPQHLGLMAETSAVLNKSRFGIGGAAFRVGAPAGCVDTVPFGCFPRKLLDKIGGMHEDLPRGEDNEINSRIRRSGYKVYLDPAIVSTYYSRDTLKGNLRQMYANGVSIGHLFYVDRHSIGVRHLVPLAFVTCLTGGLCLSWVCRYVAMLLVLMLIIYAACNLVASAMVALRHGYKFFLPISGLFLLTHLAYGSGTIVGLVTGYGKFKLR